jgi:hypothetical protein
VRCMKHCNQRKYPSGEKESSISSMMKTIQLYTYNIH